jgi:hypothetical protein
MQIEVTHRLLLHSCLHRRRFAGRFPSQRAVPTARLQLEPQRKV